MAQDFEKKDVKVGAVEVANVIAPVSESVTIMAPASKKGNVIAPASESGNVTTQTFKEDLLPGRHGRVKLVPGKALPPKRQGLAEAGRLVQQDELLRRPGLSS